MYQGLVVCMVGSVLGRRNSTSESAKAGGAWGESMVGLKN